MFSSQRDNIGVLRIQPYIQSLLFFGIIAWGGAQNSILSPLIITQNSILKEGLNKCKKFSSDVLFREANILTIRQLFIKNLLVYIKNISW